MTDYDKKAFEHVGIDANKAEYISKPSLSYWQDALRRFRSNRASVVGVAILVICVILSFIVPMVSKYAYDASNLAEANQGMSLIHYFGTDNLGRDTWTRVWYGGRISIIIGVLSAVLQAIIGITLGALAGFLGGKVDMIIMRVTEFLIAFPYLVWVTLLMLVIGTGIVPMILALTLTGWLSMARLVRGQIMQLKTEDFVLSAVSLGADSKRLILKHMIPNTMGIIIVNMTFAIPGAIFSEAFLSFIGIGIKSPMTSWGQLVSIGMKVINTHPIQLFIPCIFISLTMLSLQLIGDGLRDALDPKLRR